MAVEITRNFVGGKNKTTKIKKPKFKQNKKRGQTQTTSTAPPWPVLWRDGGHRTRSRTSATV